MFPDRRVELPVGFQNYKKALHEQFPEDGPAIDEYFRLMRITNDLFGRAMTWRTLVPDWLKGFLKARMWDPYTEYANKTVGEVLGSITKNQELIDTLAYISGVCGYCEAFSLFPLLSPTLYISVAHASLMG